MNNARESIMLRTGASIPSVGLGTWKMAEEAESAVRIALELGYRHIDTAAIYGTEEAVGKAIRGSGIPCGELFITTKVWNADQGYETALAACDASLQRLDLEYVDLYLIHWPLTDRTVGENRRPETWRALEELYESGKAKAIGVSNFTAAHLEEMQSYARIPAAVNQIERHPFMQQREVVAWCDAHDIVVTNYSPLTRGHRTDDETVSALARRYDKTEAQILLRWGVQHGNVVIPKASSEEHLRANLEIFDFEISPEDMAELDALDQGYSVLG